jgi:hypothetical protein
MLNFLQYPTFLFLALSLIPPTPSPAQEAKLKLTATPRMGNFPLTVQLQGVIQNADENDPKLHCLDADWDFDHVRFFDRKDCPPLEEGGAIERYYSTSHTFELPGTYRVRLTLRRGRERVLQADAWIRVTMVRDEDAAGSGSIDIVNTPIRAEVSELLRSPVEYAFRMVIVKGRLQMTGGNTYILHDRRSQDETIRVLALDFNLPAGDEVEVMGRFLSRTDANMTTYEQTSMLEPPKDIYIEAHKIDSLEYDVQPSEMEPSGDLTPPDRPPREAPAGPPPEVAFTLPVDEEQGIAFDTEFQIQFTEDMDPGCFSGNVTLQYSNPALPEPELSLDYDVLSRTLTVRPETLMPGQKIYLILFEGIVGKDGMPLKPAALMSRRASMDRRSGRRKVLTLTYTTR